MGERFLVTGAHGCIGSWTVRHLLADGAEVVAVDASPDDRRLRALLRDDELATVTSLSADLALDADIERIVAAGATHVIHLAALQVPDCARDPVRGARVNVAGTIALFAALARKGLETPLVYASSAAVFAALDGAGTPPQGPSGQPTTLYGVFKQANESAARVFKADHGLSSIGLRPYVVYGAGRDQGLTSAATFAMAAAARGEAYTIPYSGASEMQYAPDVAAAFVLAARSSFDGATVVNIPGERVLVEGLIAEIERIEPDVAGKITCEGRSLPFPESLDSSEFASIVGELAVTPLATGVTETIRRFRARE